jgi:SAM-dependent methyltransferase
MPELPEAIYQRPQDYDLEHVGDTEDVEFFVGLTRRWRPKRVLELACGNGRVTLPLAAAGAAVGFEVVGLELVPEMLEAARKKLAEAEPATGERLRLLAGDMRNWRAEQPFDLILTPCSSMCHLLTLEDQLAAWRAAFQNLRPGGRFVVDVTMADLASYADSFRSPPREVVEIDLDTYDAPTRTRLLRYRTTRYFADEQRARIRFLYDKHVGEAQPERSISDFESHVYYPREMRLLYLHAGFQVEAVYGDYRGRPLRAGSPQMIFCGVRPD